MWSLVMALCAQLDPASGGTLPGYRPENWAPAPKLQDAAPAGPYEYHRVYDTTDATAWAVMEIETRKVLPAAHPNHWSAEDVPYKWFIWIPPHGDVTWIESNSLTVNQNVSQSGVLQLPEVTSGGWMLIWDLRRLAPKSADLRRLLVVRNAFGNEPHFHVKLPDGVVSKTLPYEHIDGKTYHARTHIPAPHVPKYAYLEQATSFHDFPNFAPLVRADEFLRRMNSTIEGGLYYHAMGFIRHGHRLSEAEILKQVGLDVLLSRRVEGDDRAGLFQRGPTASPGTIEFVQGAVGVATISYDVFAEDVDASRHAIYNLVDGVEKARGKEIIYTRQNGLKGYVLVDGKGKLVDEAPPNLAADHRTPAPHHPRLFPPLSCVRCHGPTGGVQTVHNDVATLLAGGLGEIDLFDDLSFGKHVDRETIVDRVTGLYAAGDAFQEKLADNRNQYADAVFRATKGSGVRDKVGVVEKASENLAKQYATYWYAKSEREAAITADVALLDWGYRVKPGEGRHVLRQVMPSNRVDILIDGKPVEFSDPALEALKRGLSIRRQDQNRVFALGAYVIQQEREKVQK
jgi:hypothetical protein